MDINTIYDMAKNVTQGAERALDNKNFQGFYAYYIEYNNLVNLVKNKFGKEAERLFYTINLEDFNKHLGSLKKITDKQTLILFGFLLEIIYGRLIILKTYVHSKIKTISSQIQSIIDIIQDNLRSSIFEEPKDEKEIKNTIQTIFNVCKINYKREKISIPYSSKTYIPDFTIEDLELAIEVKFCKIKSKEKIIIDEINSDIPAYKTKYKRIIFVIFDLGFIRDVSKFKSGIEDNKDVYVIVIKK